jgi:hypothetical protein
MARSGLLAPLALAALLGNAHAAVLVVGPGGFPDIQSAIDAAQPGDTILVEPGSYTGSAITVDKPVHLLGAGSSQVFVHRIVVRGIPAGTQATIAGMGNTLLVGPPSLHLEDNDGTVVVHDVVSLGSLGGFEGRGIEVQGCARVLLSHVRLSNAALDPAEAALLVEDSDVTLVGCEVEGRHGGAPFLGLWFVPGVPAVRAVGSELTVVRSQIIGGNGSFGAFVIGSMGDPHGGAGILAKSSVVRIVGGPGTLLQGGYGTFSGSGCAGGASGLSLDPGSHAFVQQEAAILGGYSCGDPGNPVAPIQAEPGAVTWWTDPLPTLDAAPLQASLGAPVTLDVAGAPGAPVVLAATIGLGPDLELPGIFGTLVLDPVAAVPLGTHVLDAIGAATAALAIPASPALLGAVPIVQALQRGGMPGFSNAVMLPIVN